MRDLLTRPTYEQRRWVSYPPNQWGIVVSVMKPDVVERNRLVCRVSAQSGSGNIHFTVNPLSIPDDWGSIRVQDFHPGKWNDYGDKRTPQPDIDQLALSLWEAIPDMSWFSVRRGSITIHHGGAFSDSEVIQTARELILPVLEARKAAMEAAS